MGARPAGFVPEARYHCQRISNEWTHLAGRFVYTAPAVGAGVRYAKGDSL